MCKGVGHMGQYGVLKELQGAWDGAQEERGQRRDWRGGEGQIVALMPHLEQHGATEWCFNHENDTITFVSKKDLYECKVESILIS